MNQMKMNLRVKQQRHTMKISKNKRRTANKYSTKHSIQRKRPKTVDYRKNSFDDFRVMIVDPPPKFNSDESYFISSCYGPSMENQSNKVISKMVLTNLSSQRFKMLVDTIL